MTTYRGPRRIVCLTEEPTEILYALGEEERIVGISAYTVRPPEARDKPVVSAFIGGSVDKITALEPDLVIGFSDIQANLARDLIAANLQVLIFNQRTVAEILTVVQDIGALVHRADGAARLADAYRAHLDDVAEAGRQLPRRPRVYFEEWDEPTITAIEWVSELIEIAGGENVFADRASGRAASERFVTTEDVRAADPDLLLASWCGKPFDRSAAESRLGADLRVFRDDRVHEIPSEWILQPGPACLTDGLDALARHIRDAAD